MAKSTVQVLDRALDILEELAFSRNTLGLSELARRTEMSKSTVHRILQTLLSRGYVAQTSTGSYVLGSRMFHTLSYHINSLELQAEAKPYLIALQKELGLTVYLGVLDGPFVSIIEREATDRVDEIFTQVGHRNPAHCSSMGKCLLACLSKEELDTVLYGSKLEAFTPFTITSKKALLEHLHMVRKQGWALDNEESELNHRCIAAPVYNYRGDAIAVVGVSGTKKEFAMENIDEISSWVVLSAQRISASMGYVE